MRFSRVVVVVIAIFLLLGGGQALAEKARAKDAGEVGEKLWVQVRSTKVRSQPKYWAPGVATVSYGQALNARALAVTTANRRRPQANHNACDGDAPHPWRVTKKSLQASCRATGRPQECF